MTPLRLVASRDALAIAEPPLTGVALRAGTAEDADAIQRLIAEHQAEGHLLPRTAADVRRWADRFVVATADDGEIVACGELALLGNGVAEIRSLVVDRRARGNGVGERLFTMLKDRAERLGLARLCAFTHEPRYFIHLGFSIVPHTWVPEKIAADCCSCPEFRRCGQYGMLMDLAASRIDREYLFG